MSVRSLRRGSIAASRSAGVTYTIFGDTADAYIYAANATYATARTNGTGGAVDSGTSLVVGQIFLSPTYFVYEDFIAFDTSSVVGTIVSATLSLYGVADASTTDFVVQARLHDWGATVTSADWVAGASLSSKTLLASMNTSAFSAATYNLLTSDAAFVSNINQAGVTRMLLCSSRTVSGTPPTGNEFVEFNSASQTGTANDPKLVIVTA